MNEPTDPIDPTEPLTDEHLSAALDGEADAPTVSRIEASDDARARSAALAEAAALVAGGEVAPLDAATVDDLIAGALDEPVAPAHVAGGARRGPAPWLVAAAVACLVAIGLALVWNGRSTDQEVASNAPSSTEATADGSTEASDTAGEALDEGAGGADAEEGPLSDSSRNSPTDDQATTVVPDVAASGIGVIDLGAFDTADDLREALADAFPATTATGGSTSADLAPPAPASLERCATQLQITLELPDEPLQQGYATVDGERVLVYEFASTSYADGSPTTLVAAVGIDACNQVALFER